MYFRVDQVLHLSKIGSLALLELNLPLYFHSVWFVISPDTVLHRLLDIFRLRYRLYAYGIRSCLSYSLDCRCSTESVRRVASNLFRDNSTVTLRNTHLDTSRSVSVVIGLL